MAKWGNALGGYKKQRRDSKGRFGGASGGSAKKIAKKAKPSKRSRGVVKDRYGKKTRVTGVAAQLVVAGAITYGASRAFNGKDQTHQAIRNSLGGGRRISSPSSSRPNIPTPRHSPSVPKPTPTPTAPSGSTARKVVLSNGQIDFGALSGIIGADPIGSAYTGPRPKRRRRG